VGGEKVWLRQYAAGEPSEMTNEFATALDMVTASVQAAPDAVAIRYFDAVIDYRELDRLSDAFAVALQERGVTHGDRIALVLQNIPQFLIAVVGIWKAGAVVVPINPMYRGRELQAVLADSGARLVVCLESVAQEVHRVEGTAVEEVITTSELDFQSRGDERIFGGSRRRRYEGDADLLELLGGLDGRTPEPVALRPGDIAYLPYTSGTTGPPKGSMSTHANVVFAAQVYRDWTHLDASTRYFAVAPLFHITGLIANIAAPLLAGGSVILTCRFQPSVAAEAIAEHQATATIGAITVFIAWTNDDGVTPDQLASMTSIYSGGAAIPAAALEAFRAKFGHYVHNGYGLTETNSPAIVVPSGVTAPVDRGSGAVSIGVPVYSTTAEIVDDDGASLGVGEVGEIVISGPQVSAGYWRKPEETEHAMPGGRFHTGDVGFMDADGWFYVVDRKKDQINASGFKVWPREVEDVLYEHPAVREAAVVGVLDPYRGETVKAVVSLKRAGAATAEELTAFCKERLAAYKYPRIVEIIEDLPKTVSGKILRRELRDR